MIAAPIPCMSFEQPRDPSGRWAETSGSRPTRSLTLVPDSDEPSVPDEVSFLQRDTFDATYPAAGIEHDYGFRWAHGGSRGLRATWRPQAGAADPDTGEQTGVFYLADDHSNPPRSAVLAQNITLRQAHSAAQSTLNSGGSDAADLQRSTAPSAPLPVGERVTLSPSVLLRGGGSVPVHYVEEGEGRGTVYAQYSDGYRQNLSSGVSPAEAHRALADSIDLNGVERRLDAWQHPETFDPPF